MKAEKATITADLSSTDEAQYRSSKQLYSTKHHKHHSSNITKESYTCPPKYNGNIYLNYITHCLYF